jgi:PAS domain S-box-containing protein
VNLDAPAVLLVDDRPENLLALRAVLEPLHCRMVSVTSGEEALKALLQDDFAVVLLDVQMPGMDGFETADLIKGRERTRTVPIIFVTAISKERHHVFRGYSAGAVDYVLKPYDPAVLRSKVSVFLELEAKSQAAAQSEAVLRAAFDYAPIGMARLDVEGRIAEGNRALASLLGRHPADLRDRLLETLAHPDDAAVIDEERRAALTGANVPGREREVRLLTADRQAVPCALSFSLARPSGGIPETLIVQVQDLRERQRAEEDRAQRLREQVARIEAERTSERLMKVQRISDAALATLAFDDLVRELLTRTVEALTVDTAAIVLHASAEHNTVVYQAAGAVDGGARVQRRDDPDEADGDALLGGPVTSTMQAPLVVDGQEIGALHVGTLFARRFSADDHALLELAADRAALGIQRARLFQQEHRIAEELQRSLLPDQLPAVPGLSTAARYFAAGAGSQVGGDWYDTVVQPDGRLLLVIGDVAGRGIAAASTMGQLRSALRAYALDGHSPSSLLERLNAFQIGLRNRGMTTVMLVSVDPSTGDLRFAKAGHPPALVVDAAGEATWLDGITGVPLGAIDDPVYTEGSATLTPGSTLVLYTDGLVELRGEPLDRGFERLRKATIGAPDDIDALCDAILEGTLANPSADDDVTLLVLRMAGDRRRRENDGFFRRRRTDVQARQLDGEWPHVATHSARIELPGGRHAGAAARRALSDALGDVATATELVDLRIAIAEIVNNAVVHGGATGEDDRVVLRVAAAPEILRVEVSSAGAPFEVHLPSRRDQSGGFGLVIIDQLASRWGVDGADDVCVWFEIDRIPAGAPS